MQRPLRKAKALILLTGVFLFSLALIIPPFGGLTRSGINSLGLFILAGSLWITSVIPPAVTGFMVLGLIPLLGILTPAHTFSLFGNRAVFFILGAFIISAGLMKTGLARRMGLLMLSLFSGSPMRLLLGIFLTACTLSLLMPEHAVAALLFPVILDISHHLKDKREKRYSAWLFLVMAWGAVIGGVGTPLGGARAPLAMGLLEEEFGIRMSFLQWTKFAIPATLLGILVAIFWIWIATRPLMSINTEEVKRSSKRELSRLGALTREEKKVASIFGLALFGWIALSSKVDMAVIAILAASLLFLFRVILWKEVEDYVSWGVILMYGGAIALGSSLVESGAAEWVTLHLLTPFTTSPFLSIVAFTMIAIILTEWISNVATVALLLPIALGVAHTMNYSPVLITLAVTIPSGLAFSFPMGTPPNAIAYSSGKYPIRFSVTHGVPLTITMVILLVVIFRFIWPLMGLPW